MSRSRSPNNSFKFVDVVVVSRGKFPLVPLLLGSFLRDLACLAEIQLILTTSSKTCAACVATVWKSSSIELSLERFVDHVWSSCAMVWPLFNWANNGKDPASAAMNIVFIGNLTRKIDGFEFLAWCGVEEMDTSPDKLSGQTIDINWNNNFNPTSIASKQARVIDCLFSRRGRRED